MEVEVIGKYFESYNAVIRDIEHFDIETAPILIFVLWYLLFSKNKPTKKAYTHCAIVLCLIVMHRWAMAVDLVSIYKYYIEVEAGWEFYDLNHHIHYIFEYTALGLLILALLHHPHNVSYDTLLKKEIWGVWYKENNSTEYFEKQDRKAQQRGSHE